MFKDSNFCGIKKKLNSKVCSFGHLTLTLYFTLPCEMQKSQFGH